MVAGIVPSLSRAARSPDPRTRASVKRNNGENSQTLDIESFETNAQDSPGHCYTCGMNERPSGPPIGQLLSSVAREAERAFDDALEQVGGSRSTWLILLALTQGTLRNQRHLAATVGIESATLTHHLNAMEEIGLVTRRRDPANRRVHVVELTPAGAAAFQRMRGTVMMFDRQLRAHLGNDEIGQMQRILQQMRANIAAARMDASPVIPVVVPAGGGQGEGM
jgi:MarR family transcriptional regulator for hemolysin